MVAGAGIRRFLAVAATAALVLTGCVPATNSLGDPPATGETVDQLTEILEAAGIGVVDEAGAVDDEFSINTILLMREQVASMATQIVHKAGYTGYELDTLTLLEEPLPPFSYLIAGWARDHDGAGAKAARDLLGTQDWANPARIIWPDAALALYITDLTADVTTEERLVPDAAGDQFGLANAALRSLDIGALCSGAASFIQNAIATVFAAIESAAKAAETKIGGLFGRIVGLGIRLFNELVTDALKVANEVTSALLAPVREAIAIVAILQEISSAIKPWAVAMTPTPAQIVLGPSPQSGTVKASVTTQGLGDYPAWVKQCGTALGIVFPDPPGVGSKVDWNVQSWPAGVTTSEADSVVQKDNTVTLTYDVPAEDADQLDGIPVAGGSIEVKLTPSRDQIDALNKLADGLVNGALAQVPAVIRGYVAGIVSGLRQGALDRIKQFLTPSATSQVAVPMTFHLPKKPDPAAPEASETRPRPVYDPNAWFCAAYATFNLSLRGDNPNKYEGLGGPSSGSFNSYAALRTIAPPGAAADIDVILGNEERSRAIEAESDGIDESGGLDAGAESLGLSMELLEITASSIGAIERLLIWSVANCRPPYRAVFEEDLAMLNASL